MVMDIRTGRVECPVLFGKGNAQLGCQNSGSMKIQGPFYFTVIPDITISVIFDASRGWIRCENPASFPTG